MRAGRHRHQGLVDAAFGIKAIDRPPLLAFQIGDVDQRRTVRHPKFMSTAFAWSMRFDFANMAAILVDQPHAGVHQIVRPFMAEGDGMVVEGTIDRVSQPDFFLMDHLALTAAQVDAQQAAVRSFMEEIMENLPVVEWRPVAFGNLNAHQFAAIAVCHPGAIPYPVIANAINFALGEGGQVDFQQDTVIFHVIKRLIVRGEEAAEGVIPGAFRQLDGLGAGDIQQIVVPVAVKLAGEQ